ncbi:Chitobiase/beta-hexosaminidase C-terminal domain-containing protein [Ruminococcaceae bacterium FB2012]|nr:Chitobiase/beta-hexosaminidase C-terminal domain-containing protein [Ruminococcaceae bacterium FB2012]
MKKTYSSCVSLDMTVVPKPSFAPDGNVTIRIETNQPQNDLNAGAVSTYALSVNGFPIGIDRWNTNNAGLIQKDGSIQLTLTGEMLEAFGGFPLEFSTVFRETNYESLSCSAYLIFDQGSTHSVDYIGSFEEETGFITVEAPEFTADGEFTVWGKAMPSAVGSQYYTADKHTDYNVTLFADGVPVAQTRSDRKGNFKAKVLINTEGLKEYEGIEFTASGSYADGSFARVSDPVTTLYTPIDGVLKKYEIFWENHRGDAENGRMQSMVILDGGDPVSLDLLWYRGAINSDDQARVQWKMTFDNPDDITSVTVDVQRNGYVQTIDAVKQEDGTWLTPLTYIPGSAPDGTTVSYSVKTKPAHLIRKDDSDFTDEQLRSVYNRLASTSLISGLTVAENSMTFKLAGKNKTLPVSVTSKELDWDKEEAEDLDSFEPVFIYGEEEGDLLPNVILTQEGWFEGRLVDGFEGDEYVFGTRTINKYTDDPGTIYISRVLTATRCVTAVWDTANKKKFMTVIDIGGNVQHDPGINKELEKKIAESSLTEEQADLLRTLGNAETVYDIWNAFYTQLAAAFAEGAKAEVNGEPLTETAVFTGSMNALTPDLPAAPGALSLTKKIDLNKAENWTWDNVQKAIDQLKEAKEAGDDLSEWMEEIDVTSEEISKLHQFLKDNECLHLIYKAYDSNGNPGPFDIVPEIREMFGQRMTTEVKNALDTATSFGKDFSEKGLQAAWDKLGDVLTTGGFIQRMTGDRFKEEVRERAWGRKSTNMARRLYYAARYAETYERNSNNGGLCSEGINWKNWPKDIYNPDDWKNRSDREKENAILDRYNQKILTPVNYNNQSSPPGPQGRYDPSGYVYEAVPSNRIEGAEVTLFTLNGELDVTRDANDIITGISGGTAVFADSAQFGIEPNPQTTGEDGRYQWFVPEGWWRVKVTAEGFEDADTGNSKDYGLNAVLNSKDNCWYMPVLPVQLDVNIPLVSYAAPEVEKIDATTLGLLVKFSKYMDEESLKKDHFILIVNGEMMPFKLVKTDSEKSSTAEDAPSYTSTLLLTYEGAAEGDKVQLAIDNRVKSYAGVQMNERYDSGELTVKASEQVSKPEADIPSGQVEKNTAVTLSCSTDGAVIRYTTDGSEPTEKSPVYTAPIFVSEAVTVKAAAFKAGMLPSDVLTVSYTVPEETVIIVPEKVVATMNGKIVSDGDTLTPGYLTLTTATEGAEIWPC